MDKFGCRHFCRSIWVLRRLWLVILAFLVPLPLLSEDEYVKEFRCAYVIVVMAILWLTEALPISATALAPIFLLPMFGVQSAKIVSAKYLSDTNMLFLGGLIVAVALEEVDLHKRIAVGVTMLLGSRMNTLMLGLMLPTWFLSMWISNTAATAMMVSIIIAVTEQIVQVEKAQLEKEDEQVFLSKGRGRHKEIVDFELEIKEVQNGKPLDVNDMEKEKPKGREKDLNRYGKAFSLCVAYAANCGGVATLTGTPPNLVLQGQADIQFLKFSNNTMDAGLTYAKWMAFGVPVSFLLLVLCWIWLQVFFLKTEICKRTDEIRKKAVQEAIRIEWNKLGKVKFAEIAVLVSFSILALLWIFRDLPNVGGWGMAFTDAETGAKTASDSTAAMLISVLLFIIPREIPNVLCCGTVDDNGDAISPTYRPILTWHAVEKKVAWGVIFLLGGGFALASACTESGLSTYVGCRLRVFSDMEPWVMNLVLCCIVAGATEITSNTATATLLMPIMFELALTVGQNPLYLMMSAAVACSFAFMLPVATPPNAIVFSTGYIKIPDMALAGFIMNLIAILILTLAINTWGNALFGLDTVPSIFHGQLSQSKCDPLIATIATTNFTDSATNTYNLTTIP